MGNYINKVGLPNGMIKTTGKGLDLLHPLVKKFLREYKVPFIDVCCPPPDILPVGFNQQGELVYFNDESELWEIITINTDFSSNIVMIEGYIDGASKITGTTELVTGMSDSSLIISSPALINKNVTVFRGGLLNPGVDNGGGMLFHTKNFAEEFITFSSNLVEEEHIKIITD